MTPSNWLTLGLAAAICSVGFSAPMIKETKEEHRALMVGSNAVHAQARTTYDGPNGEDWDHKPAFSACRKDNQCASDYCGRIGKETGAAPTDYLQCCPKKKFVSGEFKDICADLDAGTECYISDQCLYGSCVDGRCHDERPASYIPCNQSWPVLVITDLDDTLVCSDASWPAGCDPDFGHKLVYPGVAQFNLELAAANDGPFVMKPVPVSARPDAFKFLLKLKPTDPGAIALNTKWNQDMGKNDYTKLEMLNVLPSTLNLEALKGRDAKTWHDMDPAESWYSFDIDGAFYGSIPTATKVGFDLAVGKNKYESVRDKLVPALEKAGVETCIVFVGDDGQGDCNPAMEMMRKLKFKSGMSVMRAGFAHELARCTNNKMQCDAHTSSDGAPIFKFETYLDAAAKARDAGVISIEAYKRVAVDVRNFFLVNCAGEGDSARSRFVAGWKITSEFKKIASDSACQALSRSLQRVVPPSGGSLDTVLGPAKPHCGRWKAYCDVCCKADGNTQFTFKGKEFMCNNPVHTHVQQSSKVAAVYDCEQACQPYETYLVGCQED